MGPKRVARSQLLESGSGPRAARRANWRLGWARESGGWGLRATTSDISRATGRMMMRDDTLSMSGSYLFIRCISAPPGTVSVSVHSIVDIICWAVQFVYEYSISARVAFRYEILRVSLVTSSTVTCPRVYRTHLLLLFPAGCRCCTATDNRTSAVVSCFIN
jgi:hypothetical protein